MNIFKRLLESSQPIEPPSGAEIKEIQRKVARELEKKNRAEASNEDQDAMNDDDDDDDESKNEEVVKGEEELRLALREEVFEIKERAEEKRWVLPGTFYHYRHLWMLNLPYVKFGKFKTEEVIREAKLFYLVERNRYNENREETIRGLLQKLQIPKERRKDDLSIMPIETIPAYKELEIIMDENKKELEDRAKRAKEVAAATAALGVNGKAAAKRKNGAATAAAVGPVAKKGKFSGIRQKRNLSQAEQVAAMQMYQPYFGGFVPSQ